MPELFTFSLRTGQTHFSTSRFLGKSKDLRFKETSPSNVQQIHQLRFLFFNLYPFFTSEMQWTLYSQRKDKYCTWSPSVALHHSCGKLGSYVVEGYKWITHQSPDSAWQWSVLEVHISPQWLQSDSRWPWLGLFPSALKKFFNVEGISFTPDLPCFPLVPSSTDRKHKVFMTPCSRGHIQTFIRYCVMSNAPIGFPPFSCIYVTEVVKQKCSKRCWTWPLTAKKRTYTCQANN